jgi:hypothetical protein
MLKTFFFSPSLSLRAKKLERLSTAYLYYPVQYMSISVEPIPFKSSYILVKSFICCEQKTFQVLHSRVGSWPQSQTLD